jgi:hypothetical protein
MRAARAGTDQGPHPGPDPGFPDDPPAEWWDQPAEPAAPLSYEDAAGQVPDDPAPARMARSGGDVLRVTAAVRKDIEGKLAFWLSVGGDLWNMADPYCAGAFADNVDVIAKKSAPLICQSPDLVRFFSRASGFMMWTELGMALKPVAMAILAHHILHTVAVARHTDQETGDVTAEVTQTVDWNAYTAA